MHAVKWWRFFYSAALSLFGRVCVLFGDKSLKARNLSRSESLKTLW